MTYGSGAAALQDYQKINVEYEVANASPHRLIQLLMERALSKLAMARGHMARGAVSEKGKSIGDAINIINGLQASLNHDADPTLPGNLDALYDYMCRRLLEANLRNNVDCVIEVAGLLREIKSAWDSIGEHLDDAVPASA